MDNTPNLELPYILAAQAQKHVTHNEAIRKLDALVQLSVKDRNLSTPPSAPSEGDRYLVGSNPTGPWTGYAGAIAAWQDGAWALLSPRSGWLLWVEDEEVLLAWTGTAWSVASGGGASVSLNPAPLVGVNATADTANRLSVNSPATLLNHEGAGHQVKINKAAATQTASILYQTGFSGRAEFGTTGDDKFHVKVSPDGATWQEAIVVDPANGRIGMGTATPSVNFDLTSTMPGAITVFKVANPSTTANSQARMQIATGTPNALANLLVIDQGGLSFQITCGAALTGSMIFQSGSTAAPIVFRQNTIERLRINNSGHTVPGADNASTLGSSTLRWSTVFAAGGVVTTSDEREKTIVAPLGSEAARLVEAVEPVLYRWKVGGNVWVQDGVETVPSDETGEPVEQPRMVLQERPGQRIHAGFRAQDIKRAMTEQGLDFGAWGLDDVSDPESRQWIRADELLPVLWQAVRELQEKVRRLEPAGEE